MGNPTIEQMSDEQRHELLNAIVKEFAIGSNAATHPTVITNVQNSIRRCNCLRAIERVFDTEEVDDDGEEYTDNPLNWGDTPEQYLSRFKKALDDRMHTPELSTS